MSSYNPTLEIKNFKPSESISDDSLAFTGILYIDGVRIAVLRDDGNGGSVFVYPYDAPGRAGKRERQKAMLEELAKQCRALPGFPSRYSKDILLDIDMESLMAHIANRMHESKQNLRDLKGKLWVRHEGATYGPNDWHAYPLEDTPANREMLAAKRGKIIACRNDQVKPWTLTKFLDICADYRRDDEQEDGEIPADKAAG